MLVLMPTCCLFTLLDPRLPISSPMLRLRKPKPLKIVVLGQTWVGKTCFIDMFLEGKHFINHSAVSPELKSRTISHAGDTWSLSFMDIDIYGSIAPFYYKVLNTYLTDADGIVLLYDITLDYSFSSLIDDYYLHAWTYRNLLFPNASQTNTPMTTKERFGCVLVGNKRDTIVGEDAAKRQVCTEMAEQWAASQGMRHFEISANERAQVDDVVRALIDSILRARRMNEKDKAQAV
ncbi:uncharacterized protein yc1106_05207 [Curvularia clavata]|uniref:P-loop containing nucleoside triphosphate hydrolase protein n=1 Tax=Curvularia clavata TaxID=95742 RepID=A0A9Q9DRV2_CURCL|nr:uncharacterized protein yc1106_05207 [Curvularia clavata]